MPASFLISLISSTVSLPVRSLLPITGTWKLEPSSSAKNTISMEFFGPMYLLYSVYDDAEEKESVSSLLATYIDRFTFKVESDYRLSF